MAYGNAKSVFLSGWIRASNQKCRIASSMRVLSGPLHVAAASLVEEVAGEKDATVDVKAFDWDKCWYPVAVQADVDLEDPTLVKLLDREFVLWKGQNEEWECWEEACPCGMSQGETCECVEKSYNNLHNKSRFIPKTPGNRSFSKIEERAADSYEKSKPRAAKFPVMVIFLDTPITPTHTLQLAPHID